MSAASAFDLIRLLALVAAFAFVAGFMGYLALGRAPVATADALAQSAATAGPTSKDWNLPKSI